ncbi:MAG: sensor histidine kinase [Jatrophihabitans sp.]
MTHAAGPRRWVPGSLRGRLVSATLIAALVLIGCGALLVHWQLSRGLHTGLDQSLQGRAAAVRADLVANGPPAAQSAPDRPLGALQAFTAVLDPSGRLVESEPSSLDSLPTELTRVSGDRQQLRTAEVADQEMRILIQPVELSGGRWLVVVGSSTDSIDDAEDRLDRVIVIVSPLLLLGIGAGSWILAGSALRPVERMRREVSQLAGHDPHGRVTEPESVAELALLGRTFNELLDRLSASLARQQGLVADAGHELRTPLAVLSVELELADRPHRSAEELHEAISHARDEVARLSRLSEDLLLLAGSGDSRDLTESVDLVAVLEDTVRGSRASIDQLGLTLDVVAPESLPAQVHGDAIRRALDNLLGNAMRHCPRDGVITLSARREAMGVVLEVRDTGPGFPVEFLPHAFERFRRADAARSHEVGSGAGLGLAIVESIADAHGGRATAQNSPDGGAVVRISLPPA